MHTESVNPELSEYCQQAQDWKSDLLKGREQQIVLYRILSIGLFACLTLSLMGLISLVSRESVQPFLALVDKRTGEVTTPSRLNDSVLMANWKVIRHFARNYVLDRESYNFLNLNAPYQNVMTMSTPDIMTQVNKEIRPELNRESPITTLAQHHYRTVKIHSITRLEQDRLMDIRFTTETLRVEDNTVEKSQEWRVILRWELKKGTRSLQDWDKNPLGFTVSFYDRQPVV